MDILLRLAELHGAARRSDLLGRSSSHRQLDALVASGQVVNHGGGCYALPTAPEWIVRARQFHGAVTCISWAALGRLTVLERSTRIHLAIPASRHAVRSRKRPTGAVVLHRSAALRPDALPDPPLVPPEVAMACVLKCLDPLAAIVTVDSALNKGMCTADQIRAELVGPGSVRARLTLHRCDARSESVLESIARVELRAAGLNVETGVHFPGIGWVDMVVEGRVVVELDGFEFHSSRQAFGNDRRRDRALAALGLKVLRFTYDEARTPGLVRAAVVSALAAPALPGTWR